MKKCPYCAKEIQDDAVKCKHCGEWLSRSEGGYQSDDIINKSSTCKTGPSKTIYDQRTKDSAMMNKRQSNAGINISQKAKRGNLTTILMVIFLSLALFVVKAFIDYPRNMEIAESYIQINDPNNPFTVRWGITPEELKSTCGNCEPHPLYSNMYREERPLNGQDCAITYHFDEKTNALFQITILPKPAYSNNWDLKWKEYLRFRDWIESNITSLSSIEYEYDSEGNTVGARSLGKLNSSGLIHDLRYEKMSILHVIVIFKPE